MQDKNNKIKNVALVPGGSRGIGRAIAARLAAQGWALAVAHRDPDRGQQAQQSVAALERAGASSTMLERCDVGDPAQATELVRKVEARWGRLDVLVNAVGPFHRVPLLEETADAWRETFDANLHSVFYLCQAAAGGMRARGWGRVLNFGVVNADAPRGQTQVTAYSLAKLAVLALTRSLAASLAADGVTVNAISPGFIDSGSIPRKELAKLAGTIPAGRLGELEDVTGAAMFLLSDEARYITGANIQVSGGWGL